MSTALHAIWSVTRENVDIELNSAANKKSDVSRRQQQITFLDEMSQDGKAVNKGRILKWTRCYDWHEIFHAEVQLIHINCKRPSAVEATRRLLYFSSHPDLSKHLWFPYIDRSCQLPCLVFNYAEGNGTKYYTLCLTQYAALLGHYGRSIQQQSITMRLVDLNYKRFELLCLSL